MSSLPTPTPPSNGGRAEGERRKRRAHDLLELYRAALLRRARRAMVADVVANGVTSIEAVRSQVPVPAGIDPRVFGAVPGALKSAGVIRFAGYTLTTRAEAHARPISRYELADPDAALVWLRSNPDLLDPAPIDPASDYQI